MSESTRKLLVEFYGPYNAKLNSLLKTNYDWNKWFYLITSNFFIFGYWLLKSNSYIHSSKIIMIEYK